MYQILIKREKEVKLQHIFPARVCVEESYL